MCLGVENKCRKQQHEKCWTFLGGNFISLILDRLEYSYQIPYKHASYSFCEPTISYFQGVRSLKIDNIQNCESFRFTQSVIIWVKGRSV